MIIGSIDASHVSRLSSLDDLMNIMRSSALCWLLAALPLALDSGLFIIDIISPEACDRAKTMVGCSGGAKGTLKRCLALTELLILLLECLLLAQALAMENTQAHLKVRKLHVVALLLSFKLSVLGAQGFKNALLWRHGNGFKDLLGHDGRLLLSLPVLKRVGRLYDVVSCSTILASVAIIGGLQSARVDRDVFHDECTDTVFLLRPCKWENRQLFLACQRHLVAAADISCLFIDF